MSDPIHVSLIRSGGVGGLHRSAALDTSSLDEERATELRRLVRKADLTHVSEPTIRFSRGADRFHYTLSVRQGDMETSLTFAEDKTPDQLLDLIDMIWREGRPSLDDTQTV